MIFDSYLRWRHSKGFGVHSPFAYHIVTTAITPGRRYAYYGYAPIDTILETTPAKDFSFGKIRKDARLLLRLSVALGAKRIFLSSEAHPAFRVAAEVSGGMVVPDMGNCYPSADDLVLLTPFNEKSFNLMKDAIAGGAAVMLTSPSPFSANLLKGILSQDFDGVMLYGKRTALLLPRPHTAHARYSMAF